MYIPKLIFNHFPEAQYKLVSFAATQDRQLQGRLGISVNNLTSYIALEQQADIQLDCTPLKEPLS